MINIILLILAGIVGGYFLSRIRSAIIKQGIEQVKDKIDTSKLKKGLLSVSDPVLWIKDLVSMFNIRKIFILLFIFSIVAGVFFYKGKLNTPINFKGMIEATFLKGNDQNTKKKL